MASKAWKEVDCRGQSTKTVFTHQPAEQAEDVNWFVTLRRCLGDPLGNCLENTLAPLRLDASKKAPPEEKIPNGSDGFGRLGVVDYFFQKFVAGCQGAAHDLQDTTIVQLLQHFVCRQHGFSMFLRSALEAGLQLSMRV